MAILPSLPGIEVAIHVNGQPLVEYDDDSLNETLGAEAARLGPRTVSKYVESVTNEEFSIEIFVASPYQPTSPSLTFEAWVDGTWITGYPIRTTDVHLLVPQTRSVKGPTAYDSTRMQGTLHHFKFTNIKTTSDEDKLSDIKTEIKRMSKVGMIEVKAYRTSAPVSVPRKNTEAAQIGGGSKEVHEKALKGQAKSHGVDTGRKTAVTNATCNHVEFLDGMANPIANFVFQYRSKESLRQLYIIGRTPEPEPLLVSLSPKPRVKRERGNGDNVKSEPPAKRSRYKMTIDLTGDSSDDEGSIITLE